MGFNHFNEAVGPVTGFGDPITVCAFDNLISKVSTFGFPKKLAGVTGFVEETILAGSNFLSVISECLLDSIYCNILTV